MSAALSSKTRTDADVEAASLLGERLIRCILENEPFASVKTLIDNSTPLWYQNEEGMSCLHAAAYGQNADLVKYLIERGAVWNAVDNFQNTAGDIALSLNDAETYTIIRNAGIRAELLLSLLSSHEPSEDHSTLIIKGDDSTAAGSTDTFLTSKLVFKKDEHSQDICILKVGEEEIGVMMGWERNIMEETVQKMCQDHDHTPALRVLNVGFGLGIIDTLFQSLAIRPAQHIIIEPHPDVLQHMKDNGWYEKSGVKILEGKWQDLIDTSEHILGAGGFDMIYFDTFSEDYSDLHQFFEHLPDLLAGPGSTFSFFHGLGATNALFYDVYSHIAELHLADVGIDVQWSDINVNFDMEKRWGDSRKYFTLPLYRLPLGRMAMIPQ